MRGRRGGGGREDGGEGEGDFHLLDLDRHLAAQIPLHQVPLLLPGEVRWVRKGEVRRGEVG